MKDDELHAPELNELYATWAKWLEMTLESLEMNPNRTIQEDELLKRLKSVTDERNIMDEFLAVKYTKPNKLLIANPKLVNLTFDNGTDLSEETEMIVSSRKAKQEVTITAKVVSLLDGAGITLTSVLSEQDRCVFDGVCTLFESGQTVVTAKQIYQTYTGISKPNPQAIGHVTKSLNKMRTTLIDIDWTKHANMKNLDVGDNVTITRNGYLLPLESVTFKSGGKVVTGYQIIKEPAYLTYSRLTKQLVTIPAEMLKLETVSMSPERIAIQHYMLRHIEYMKNEKGRYGNRTMLFETIFEKCNLNVSTRQYKARYVDAIEKILTEWVERKYIKRYEVTTKGKANIGVEIIL